MRSIIGNDNVTICLSNPATSRLYDQGVRVKKLPSIWLALCAAAGLMYSGLPCYALDSNSPPKSPARATAPATLIHFRIRAPEERMLTSYSAETLRLALEKTQTEFGPFQLEALQEKEPLRAIRLLLERADQNIIVEASYDPALYSAINLSFVPFPIDLGLMGYRACFINPNIKPNMSKVTRLADLSPYVFGHGIGWTDTKIMRLAGLQVTEQSNIEGLYRMVASGRIDFFCRSIAEAVNEMSTHRNITHLTVDERFLLNYNMPRFLFVNKQNTVLQTRVEQGLLTAFKDGSLIALWHKHYQPAIDTLGIKQRLIFKINNSMPAELNDGYKAYYYNFTIAP